MCSAPNVDFLLAYPPLATRHIKRGILKTENYSRQSKKLLFTTFNCAKSQLIPLQMMQEIHDDDLIMALTGLAGGILNNGSTCGVVIGGAISSAMIRDKELSGQWTREDEIQLLREIGADVAWFENRFGTSLCREREEVDYQRITALGLLNPRKAKGCVARSGASMEYFVEKYDEPSASAGEALTASSNPARSTRVSQKMGHVPPDNLEISDGGTKTAVHCAPHILRKIREQTGVGNEQLERVSVALDGGIGLAGGGCGALSGALMALGLKYALDPKGSEPNKLRNIYRSMDSEFFRMARILVSKFIKEFGRFECSKLTATAFEDWAEFDAFRGSRACDALNKFLVEESVEIINLKE